jgi:hypothetical protein
MANVDWYIEGVEFGSCNCAFGCPCQFEALPTYGDCRGLEALRIEKGHFGDTDLAGLNVAVMYSWPGPIFEGNGAIQAIIDERANADQRNALASVLYGGETDEEATHWWVFHAMSSTVHEPLFKAIEFTVDIEARTAKLSIPGIVEASGSPIIPPYGGGPHRAAIAIPNGIEFEFAEMGSSTAKTSGAAIELDIVDKYGQFNILRHSGSGVVH